jgi:hypothetical protein
MDSSAHDAFASSPFEHSTSSIYHDGSSLRRLLREDDERAKIKSSVAGRKQKLLKQPVKLPVQQHRRAEDVDYWRQRAGWFNDDEKMVEYNNGVYDTFYQMDDDGAGSGARGGRRHHSRSDLVKTILKVVFVVVALALSALMFRAIMRRIGSSKKDKKRSDSRSRSGRSKSRSRSRSRSRKSGGDYNLMEEDGDAKSARSKRSHRSSKGERRSSSRSRSRNRSRSKSRADGKEEPASPPTEPVLV